MAGYWNENWGRHSALKRLCCSAQQELIYVRDAVSQETILCSAQKDPSQWGQGSRKAPPFWQKVYIFQRVETIARLF